MSQPFGFRADPKPEYIYTIAEKTTKLGTGGYTGYYKVGKTDNLQERVKKTPDCQSTPTRMFVVYKGGSITY